MFVFSARPLEGFPPGHISMSDPQRTWAQVALTDMVTVRLYDIFSQGGQSYLASMDMEIGFAGKKRTEMPYDQDQLARVVTRVSTDYISTDKTGKVIMADSQCIELRKPNPGPRPKDFDG